MSYSSDNHRLRTVEQRHNTASKLMIRVALVGFAAVLSFAAYVIGQNSKSGHQGARTDSRIAASSLAEEAQDELALASQQLATLQAGLAVEQGANTHIRSELSRAQARIGLLEQEVELYRALLDSSARQSGLSVHSLKLFREPAAATFRFRLVLIQRSQRYEEVEGTVKLRIRGSLGDLAHELPLEDIAIPRGTKGLPIRLRYFQVLERTIQLPEKFTPHELIVEGDTSGSGRQKISIRQPWKIQGGE